MLKRWVLLQYNNITNINKSINCLMFSCTISSLLLIDVTKQRKQFNKLTSNYQTYLYLVKCTCFVIVVDVAVFEPLWNIFFSLFNYGLIQIQHKGTEGQVMALHFSIYLKCNRYFKMFSKQILWIIIYIKRRKYKDIFLLKLNYLYSIQHT